MRQARPAVSTEVIEDVTKYLPVHTAAPISARAIFDKIECWAPETIKKALRELTKMGTATATPEPCNGGVRLLYRSASVPS